LEVESIVRETSEKVLSDPTVSREKRELRAVALGMMGEVSLTGHRGESNEADANRHTSPYGKREKHHNKMTLSKLKRRLRNNAKQPKLEQTPLLLLLPRDRPPQLHLMSRLDLVRRLRHLYHRLLLLGRLRGIRRMPQRLRRKRRMRR
jgi:hypothetical protein